MPSGVTAVKFREKLGDEKNYQKSVSHGSAINFYLIKCAETIAISA